MIDRIEYKVMAGKMLLGRTTDYNEAIEWMNNHNSMRVAGAYARIVECFREGE